MNKEQYHISFKITDRYYDVLILMTKEQVKTIKEFHKLYDKVKEVFNNNYLIEDFQIEYYPYINIVQEVEEE